MDVVPVQSDVSATSLKPKPAVPKKPATLTADFGRSTHVRDMIRKLQEQSNGGVKPSPAKMGGKTGKIAEKEDSNTQSSSQTLEDLKAIDEDIEKLRKQIEERDKIISALREAAEAKDKKLDNLMEEYSKLQSGGKIDLDSSSETNRATSASPSSPPLCNGELCWTDSFVSKNYHEPVYAQLLNDHAALQKIYNDLRKKLETKTETFAKAEDTQRTDSSHRLEGGENAINLIMADQIRALKEREAQLIWEAEELREQNDLMEFRILELEECRKEFLDKEVITEEKHRPEKIVWRERDLEEVSDSGVMSLPTSEDLTSDSELGEAIRNYSPLGGITTLGLSTPEISHSDPIVDLKLKKCLKSSECLQESGIFVDAEPSSDCAIPPGTHSRACQTESVLDKTLLDIIDSSCDLFLSKNPGYLEESKLDDLSTEISKLSVIQKRIQQKTTPPSTVTPTRSPHTLSPCPHSNGLLFYEERLAQLEDKIRIYESSGDAQDDLLAKRLQKEVELAHRVKELTDKVASLEASNRKLEEEKCEFEEAENDSRFQCQRLEIRLQELIDKNAELEMEMERQKVIMNAEKRRVRKNSSLEGLLSKYEQRNYELEEKDVEARQRLSMIEAAMPAIVAYNVFKMVQNSNFTSIAPAMELPPEIVEDKIKDENPVLIQKLEEAFKEQQMETKEEESVAEREEALKAKIRELEKRAAKDRESLEEMTSILKAYRAEEKTGQETDSLRSDDVDLFDELKQMVANEIELRTQIEMLEKKEKAYMQSLEKADDIWAGMEADYKRRLSEAEEANLELQNRIADLEKAQKVFDKTLSEQPIDTSVGAEQIHSKIQELISENKELKAELERSLDEKFEEQRKLLQLENASLKEEVKKLELDSAKDEHRYQLLLKELELAKQELRHEKALRGSLVKDLEEKSQSVTSLEGNLQSQISELTHELSQKSKELSNLEVTVAELREEVETLENKVKELVDTIQTKIKNQDEGLNWMEVTQGNQKLFLKKSTGGKRRYSAVLVSIDSKEAQTWRPNTQAAVLNAMGYTSSTKSFPAKIDAGLDRTVASEILHKTEIKVPRVQILLPKEFRHRFVVFTFPKYPRQELKLLQPRPEIAKQIFIKSMEKEIMKIVHKVPEIKLQKEIDWMEEEVFQLSIKNTELQQTLEKMEEESKSKEKEFEELQRIALEIRREQNNLKLELESHRNAKERPAYKAKESENFPARDPQVENPEIQQVENPVKPTEEGANSILSSLQIAIDNLQSKYRSKTVSIQPLLEGLNEKGDNRDAEDLLKHLALDIPPGPRPVGPAQEGPPLEAPRLRPSVPRVPEVDPDFSFVAPITTLRKIGDDGIFLEWDVSQQPQCVTGFEIKVNGLLLHRVRSSTRNRALLRPLNLSERISIILYAMSGNGRSTKSSHVIYPNENYL